MYVRTYRYARVGDVNDFGGTNATRRGENSIENTDCVQPFYATSSEFDVLAIRGHREEFLAFWTGRSIDGQAIGTVTNFFAHSRNEISRRMKLAVATLREEKFQRRREIKGNMNQL